ncbi:MAG: undecaprenyldiphospho-muramoylpentapeptide beta-N-acetylglucosaminyltransferase [Clostridia bacterium]|nr:undecaprenyldiphospho-muramoylpentapeptide beta-N-acetylglucosaminyltransferase [Clostridia bacterium]
MNVIIAAGGTGGHINPALAAAEELKRRFPDAEITFVGCADKMEATIIPAAGYEFRVVEAVGFVRRFTPKAILANIRAVIIALRTDLKVRRLFRELKPDAVVGFGGYVSGPVVRRAAKMGIPTAVHEQNSYPGVANKLLAPVVDRVMLTTLAPAKYMKCKNEPVLTGLPVRKSIFTADREAARRNLSVPDGSLLVVSFGGSLGARTLNNAVLELMIRHGNDEKIRFIHSYGTYSEYADFPERLQRAGINGGTVTASSYLNNMDELLAAADLVISRAGASTLFELAAAGKASVLIPSPNVTENHQFHNAMTLADAGAAVVIEEKDLTDDLFCETVDGLLKEPGRLRVMGEAAKTLAIPDSAERIADIIEGLACPR